MLDISAWLLETQHRPAAERGAILSFKMHFWRIGPLPDDDDALARIAGMDAKDWKKARKALAPLFVIQHGEWQRADWNDELEAAYAAVKKARERSKKGHDARWRRNASSNASGNASSNASGNASSNASGSAASMPASMLKYTEAESAQTKAPKSPSQGDEFAGQPDFESDALQAEAALRIGGAA
jgi:uncharacterized protein YdaU (DUF1376 family)